MGFTVILDHACQVFMGKKMSLYIYCVYPAISKGPKQPPNCLKIAEISVVLDVFKGVICDVGTDTVSVTVSFCCSTGIRYQKNYSETG
jgi:hypothetical protein